MRRLSPPIDQNEVTLRHLPFRGDGVRQRRTRPHGHNRREAATRSPEPPNLMLKLRRDLLLRLMPLQLSADDAEGTLR